VTRHLTQKHKDNISKGMRGLKKWTIDHRCILGRMSKICKKDAYRLSTAKSAAYIMFMDASREDRIRYMRQVRKVVK